METKTFTKKFVWEGKDGAGTIFKGEGDTERECNDNATKAGSSTCYTDPNPNYQQPPENQLPTDIPPTDSEKLEAVNAYIAQIKDEAAHAVAFAAKDAAAWKNKAMGLADLVIAGWQALIVGGAVTFPEGLPDPDFLKQARAYVAPPDAAAALDTLKKAEADKALESVTP